MNNLNTIFKSKYLVLAIVLCSVSFGFAQQVVVRVPATCNVVVAGLGGTTGFGGRVGDLGVVAMPDPYPLNTFTAIPSTGVTIGTWSLLGDLSFKLGVTSPLYDNAIATSTGVGNDIMSYNKKYRPSEGVAPSQNFWARSKGRVRIAYSATCGGSITFEVYKVYLNDPRATPPSTVPQIVGPDCLLPNTQYTYSVDQIASDNANDSIGFDKYYWSGLPPGVQGATTTYYSADFSSITFVTPLTFSSFTIQCCYGEANPWDGGIVPTSTLPHNTCVTKLVGVSALPPSSYTTTLTGASMVATPGTNCLPTGQTSFTVSYTTPSSGTYTWSAPNTSWNLATTTNAGNTILTVSNIDNNPGNLTLTATSGSCLATVINYQITRSFVAPLVISPASSNCLVSPSTNNSFSIGPNAANNATSWTITPVGTATPGALTYTTNTVGSTIYINVAAGTPAGAYTLKAISTNATCSGNITYTVYVKPAQPTIVTTASNTCVNLGSTAPITYTCNTIAGATGYLWSFPAGWNATSFTTASASITVTPLSSTAVLNGNATVTAIGVAGSSCNTLSPNFAIGYNGTAPTTVNANCSWAFGTVGTTTITIANAPNPFYGTYTLAANAALFTSYVVNANGTITLTTPATLTPGTYTLNITHTVTGCTSGTATNVTVTVTSNGSTMTTLPGTASDTYFVGNSPAGATFVWLVGYNNNPPTQVPTPVATPNQLAFSGTLAPPTAVICSVTFGGCTTTLGATSFGSHSQKQANGNIRNTVSEGIKIYPNPNGGNFTIKVADFKENATAILYDISGKQLDSFTLKIGENTIQKEGLSRGTYIVLLNVDGKTEGKKISIK